MLLDWWALPLFRVYVVSLICKASLGHFQTIINSLDCKRMTVRKYLHQCPNGSGCCIELCKLMAIYHVPEASRRGISRNPFKHKCSGAIGKWSVDNIRVTSNPCYICYTGENILGKSKTSQINSIKENNRYRSLDNQMRIGKKDKHRVGILPECELPPLVYRCFLKAVWVREVEWKSSTRSIKEEKDIFAVKWFARTVSWLCS